MSDPYKLLEVSRDASDEEIKKVYRRLSRKFHPDANINNPDKDRAEEMFKRVQQAYDQIMREREYGHSASGGYGYGGSAGYGGGQTSSDSQEDNYLRAASNYIQSGYYQEALNVLNQIGNRTAAWYYYSAMANMRIGNNITARQYAQEAVKREPQNMQYQMLLRRFTTGEAWYQGRQAPYGGFGDNMVDWCCEMCMLNALCNCCCCC